MAGDPLPQRLAVQVGKPHEPAGNQQLPALAGLLGTLACLLVFGPERFLIPAMLLITLVLTLFQGRLSAGKEAEA